LNSSKDSGDGHEHSDDEYVENGEDDVESHYEPVLVAPGVKLQARAGGRTTAELDDDVEAIYQKWVDDRIKHAISEKACTFLYTDRIYALQKWYPCKTCLASGKFKGSEAGACEVCKDLCHKGHDLGPENNSVFVCSCGELKCAVSQTVKERDVFDDYRTLLTKAIEKERKLRFSPGTPGKTYTSLGEFPQTPSIDGEDTPLRKGSSPTSRSRQSPHHSPHNSPPHTPTATPPLTPKPTRPTRASDESALDDSRRKEHRVLKERTRSGSFCG